MTNGDHTIVGDYLWDKTFAQAVDRLSSERFLLPNNVLMENAGRAVADAVLDLLDEDAEAGGDADAETAPVICLVGPGNNGGDGLVAARWLAEAGISVHVFLVGHENGRTLSPLCQAQLGIWQALGHTTRPWQPGCFKPLARTEPIVIDAVLGLGWREPLAKTGNLYLALADAATLRDRTVVAVDVPSGLDSDSGAAQHVPLTADITVTFGGRKPAHALAPARDSCGEVMCMDIGFPKAAQAAALAGHRPLLMSPDARALLRQDPWSQLGRSAHKYDRGHVLIVGGSAGKTGAPLLAALAALRGGAGWVTVAMPQSALASMRGEVPREVVFEDLFEGDLLNPLRLERFLGQRRVGAVVAGPGAVSNPLTADCLAVLAAFTAGTLDAGKSSGKQAGSGGRLVVLDAGALHGIASLLSGLKEMELDPEHWLLTPHPGEWSKIGPGFDEPPLTPAAYRRAVEQAARLGVSLLFKGATPLLIPATLEQPGSVSHEGSSALARAGSGDVLAGIAGAHGAIGCGAATAILRGLVQLAWAGEIAAGKRGAHAVLARDVIDSLGLVMQRLEQEDDGEDTGP